jgi:hypothetical protein
MTGGIVKNWKKRFFVLSTSGLLYYYKDEKVLIAESVPIAPPFAPIHSCAMFSTHFLRLSFAAADGQSDAPQGVIMLERSTTGDGDEAKRAHAFSLVTPLRTYLFSCDSDAERDEWRKVLIQVLSSCASF